MIETDSYILMDNITHFIKKNKICMFDLDGTIIKFNLKTDKYELLYSNTIDKLREISQNNNIIIITNQKQLNKQEMFEMFMIKITNLLTEFTNNDIFVDVYISTKSNKYRKPNISFMELINKKYGNKIEYYCGDALGRKNDFNDTDLKFALNLNINILSPEQLFLGKSIENKIIKYPILNKEKYNFTYEPNKKEMIILVGYPGCGKSSISAKISEIGFLNDIYYEIINRDVLKTMQKCVKLTKKALENNFNVIIDNTNPNKKSRKIFIDIAKEYNYNVIVILINTSYEISMHNNYYRHTKYNKELIPEIAYNIFKSRYEKPLLSEGIKKIIKTGINIYDFDYDKFFY
jgi:bifunctional polynucleotide phosphatase/kinase